MTYNQQVRQNELQRLASEAQHVTIVPERIREIAALIKREIAVNRSFQTDPKTHPDETLPYNDRDTIQFYLVLASQHFCIWRRIAESQVEAWDIEIEGKHYVGGRGINAAHIRALRRGKNILDPTYLASMTLEDVKDFYRDERTGRTDLQLLPQRLAKFNELGRVLLDRYDGHAVHLLEDTSGFLFRDDGRGLIQQLTMQFPFSYFDWPFCKLATLVGKFLSVRNGIDIPTTPEYKALTQIQDPENFEVAADYYIPLFFIRVGIFQISEEFSHHLLTRQLIDRDSRLEREYRACTMVAGRAIAEKINASIPAVDEELWRTGYMRCRLCRVDSTDAELPCPYRASSIGYQEDHRLMDLGWPLVLTTCY